MTALLINDLTRHCRETAPQNRRAVERVLRSGWFILGEECASFEHEFANYCGTSHCVGLANGTDAIELGLRALGVRSGERVGTVANAGFYSSAAITAIGAIPVFIDVDEANHLISLSALDRVLEQDSIAALVVTHLYGLMNDLSPLMALADKHKFKVLEDCAQAHGAILHGERAGSVGHAAAFSFYPTKNLGALGDGGALTTKDSGVAARAAALRQYGWQTKYRVALPDGRNSRLDEIQAAVLREKLPMLDVWNKRRRAIASRYSTEIRNSKVQCPPARGEESVAHLYVIRAENRDGLLTYLRDNEITADIHYPVPDHLQPALAGLYAHGTQLSTTEHMASRVLTLPCFPEMTDAEANQVILAVNRW